MLFISQAMTYLMLRLQLVQQPQITRLLKNFSSIRGPAFVPTHSRISNRNSCHLRMQTPSNHHYRPQPCLIIKKLIRLWVQTAQMIWTKVTMERQHNQLASIRTVQMVFPNRQKRMKWLRITAHINAVVLVRQSRHPIEQLHPHQHQRA